MSVTHAHVVKPKVLVTGADGLVGAFVVDRLRTSHATVVTTGRQRGLDVVMPPLDARGAIEGLWHAIDAANPDLVVPTHEADVASLAPVAERWRRSERVAPGVRCIPVVVAAPGSVALCADRLLTLWALSESRVPVPSFAPITQFRSLLEAQTVLGSRVVTRTRSSLPDEDLTADTWANVPARSIVHAAPVRTTLIEAFRRPGTGSTSAVALEPTALPADVDYVRTHDPEAVDLAIEAIEAIGIDGPVEVEIGRGTDGRLVVVSMLARFGVGAEHAPELLDDMIETYTTLATERTVVPWMPSRAPTAVSS